MLRDGWIHELPTAGAPSPPPSFGGLPGNAYVLELPLGSVAGDGAAVFRSAFHHLPVANGYSSYYPPHYAPLASGLEDEEDGVLSELASRGSLVVIVDHRRDQGGNVESFVARHPGARPLSRDGWARVYLIPEAARPKPLPEGPEIPIRAVSANVGVGAPNMIDRDPRSLWSTAAAQQGTERVLIDLGLAQRVSRLDMTLGHVTDFPRELLIETSLDGEVWSEVSRSELAGRTLRACLDDPLRVVLPFDLGGRQARFIRLRQLGYDTSRAWSVSNLRVLGSGPGQDGL
jgi:hypothetical protein